ncbi:MAG: peptidoglycan-associated lipoprotein [Thiomicrorhabdus sp.]|nr:MAG: peptidoglycan-associated lipoprotein [Thiomicrorhabdus sp.]
MSITYIKQLLAVSFLGFALVGCSSTPTAEENSETAESIASKQAATEKVNSDIDVAKMNKANALAAQKAELLAAIEGKVVHFDFDRSEVRSKFYKVIKSNADYMALETSAMITIKGYCDERGTREYNLALGERRAKAVKSALVAEGVSPSRITVVSFGEDNPVAEGHNESSWSLNRRAEFSY